MQPNEHLKKVMKIFIFAFLCTEMRTSYTHRDGSTKQRGIETNGKRQQSRAPFQASIRLKQLELDYYGKGHICSGALVAPSVVLTVAHCLYNQASKSFYHPAELRVQLGSRQRFAPTSQSQLFGVTHIYQPPKSLALSLAILMLDQDVVADPFYIQPIAMSSLTNFANELAHLSSWGLAVDDHQQLHEMLTLDLGCKQSDDSQLSCYVPHGKQDLEYELDAGAPITKGNQLIGLLSSTVLEDGFVDVPSHMAWIQSQVGDGSTQNSSWWGILGLIVFTGYVIKCSRKSFLS